MALAEGARVYAARPERNYTVHQLASDLEKSPSTLYRRFGDDPRSGVLVTAACVLFLPLHRAVGVATDAESGMFATGITPTLGLRAFAYTALRIAKEDRQLIGLAHRAAREGHSQLRPIDVEALVPDLAAPGPEPTSPTVLQSYDYIPVLVDAAARLMRAVGLDDSRAGTLARQVLGTSEELPELSAMGATNRFLDWARPTFDLVRPPRQAGEAWLITQLIEQRSSADVAHPELAALCRVAAGLYAE